MNESNEAWRSLRVGDRIRIVRFPTDWSNPRYFVPPETRRIYKLLMRQERALLVEEIDDDGFPWIGVLIRAPGWAKGHHSIRMDEDSWELVKDAVATRERNDA